MPSHYQAFGNDDGWPWKGRSARRIVLLRRRRHRPNCLAVASAIFPMPKTSRRENLPGRLHLRIVQLPPHGPALNDALETERWLC
jgi:hypothetical protein